MNLTTLTHRDALCLNARFTSREEAIHVLLLWGKFPVLSNFWKKCIAVKALARPP